MQSNSINTNIATRSLIWRSKHQRWCYWIYWLYVRDIRPTFRGCSQPLLPWTRPTIFFKDGNSKYTCESFRIRFAPSWRWVHFSVSVSPWKIKYSFYCTYFFTSLCKRNIQCTKCKNCVDSHCLSLYSKDSRKMPREQIL